MLRRCSLTIAILTVNLGYAESLGGGATVDPNALSLAGLAAYRSDQIETALDLWKQSLALAPNPALARVYERVRREEEASASSARLEGTYVLLRYDPQALPLETARDLIEELDADYGRISAQLGCSVRQRIAAIIETRDSYLATTGAVEWSAGQYDGRIHLGWTPGSQLDSRMRRTLAHELVHAVLDTVPSGSRPWPTWLQEGLAQRLSMETPGPVVQQELRKILKSRRLPRLEDLPQDWSRLSFEAARTAYAVAFAAADALYEDGEALSVSELLEHPQTIVQVAAELDKQLGL